MVRIYNSTEPGSQLRKLAVDLSVAGHIRGRSCEFWLAMLQDGASGAAGRDCTEQFMRDLLVKMMQSQVRKTEHDDKDWSIKAEDYYV